MVDRLKDELQVEKVGYMTQRIRLCLARMRGVPAALADLKSIEMSLTPSHAS